MAQLTNKCSDDDIEYFVKECGDIMGLSQYPNLMILKRFCTIFFRKSLSIRAQTCHEVLLLPVNRMAGEAMCLTKQRKMEHQIKHTLIYLKLSYEVADAPIT